MPFISVLLGVAIGGKSDRHSTFFGRALPYLPAPDLIDFGLVCPWV